MCVCACACVCVCVSDCVCVCVSLLKKMLDYFVNTNAGFRLLGHFMAVFLIYLFCPGAG